MDNKKIEKKLEEIEQTLKEMKESFPQPRLDPVVVPVVIYEHKDHSNDPCWNCPNNPKNNKFASGFCNCALPYMYGNSTVIC